MKKLFFCLFFGFCAFRMSAQAELKISPVPLLFGYVAASFEYGFTKDFGLEADYYYFEDFNAAAISAKYYFNPGSSIDRFHVGAFIGAAESAPGLGFLLGYKLVSRKNILFELGAGIGRSLDDSGIGYFKFHIGYRFGKKSPGAPKKSDNY